MIRATTSAAILCLFGACATSMPVGARASLSGYEPFTRPARGIELPQPDEAPMPVTVQPGAREAAVSVARTLVGKPHIVVGARRFGDDCTGLVRAAYERIGVDLMSAAADGDNGVTAIYRFAAKHGRIYEGGRPVAGDLVFFRDTYDLNRDGLTHVGLVEDVEADATVIVIHRVARGVVRYRMNLDHPNARSNSAGQPLNDYLRAPAPGAKPRLTAQLFAGYATLLPIEPRLARR